MTGTDTRPVVISLRDVGVCFKRHVGILKSSRNWVLKDISFDVLEGQTLGVIGGNGAGKSTILKVIADIMRPDEGTVVRHPGLSATLLSLQVGFLRYLTGRENIVLSGMFLGMTRRQLQRRSGEIIEFSELGQAIDDPVGTYSVGMRARLGFAIANEAEPDILLLDEMLGVGDRKFKLKSKQAIESKVRSNKTVILVSHNMPTILELCDRVIWIERGRVVDSGLPQDIVAKYDAGAPRIAAPGAAATTGFPAAGAVADSARARGPVQ